MIFFIQLLEVIKSKSSTKEKDVIIEFVFDILVKISLM